jgi:signal transduction histidine kinase
MRSGRRRHPARGRGAVSSTAPSRPLDSIAQLQSLLQASLALTTELSLPGVLQRITHVAREVLQARYAALSVLDESGTGLSQFLTAGVDDATRAAIGPPPTGKGVLGLLISEGRPLRLARLAAHPRSAGFPSSHPPMQSFLGVPILVRGTAYGNLYVTEKQGAPEFSEADEALALTLAAQAGAAIDNALTFEALRRTREELERREQRASQLTGQMQALAQASLALTTELSLERVLQTIAEVARDVLHARYAAVGVINEGGTGLSQFVTAGIDEATKRTIGRLPSGKGVLGLLISERRPIRLGRLSSHSGSAGFPPHHPPMHSFLGVPIMVRDKAYGNLYVTEKQDAVEFSDADENVAMMLASQAGIAIENAHSFEALREAQEELVRKERLATLGQLAGSISHELRNPLGVIKNSVYYLRMVLPGGDLRTQKHLGILEREIGTANRIVTDLLDFARVKSPNRSATDPSGLVGDLLDRTPVPPHVTLARDLPDGLPPIEVDRLQIEHILTNLIANAIQAMPEGGTLRLATEAGAGAVAISVADTGTGIAPDQLAKIFQPLYTTKAKGIGLGLALARDLAGVNGGEIAVESTPGIGSRFVLRFPTHTGD